jgi:hypothetical protein
MNIDQSKYYKDGVVNKQSVYALYDIIADCFLTVLPNKNIAIHLKYILSSRYHLHICQLDVACNYTHGMITNANCDQWSLTNRSQIQFSDPVSNDVVSTQELCATTETPQYDMFGEKLWCLFCTHYLYILDNELDVTNDPSKHYNKLYWHYSKVDEYLNGFLDITTVDYPWPRITPDLRKQVLKLLYLYRGDIQQVDNEIKQLIGTV